MAENSGESNSFSMEMRGSGRWNLREIKLKFKSNQLGTEWICEEDSDVETNDDEFLSSLGKSLNNTLLVSTIDMKLAPGGTLIGTQISKGYQEVSDILGKWNDKTIEFTSQSRDDDEGTTTTTYKGVWSEDFQTIKLNVDSGVITKIRKFEMKMESQENKANASKRSEMFCNNLANYYKNSPDKIFFDFHIVSKNGEKIPAHKFILGSQSQYFAALFRRETPDYVKMEYPGNAIKSSIDFMYSQEVDINVDNVQDILAFAHYISLTSLGEMATAFIIKNMDISNVVDVLILGDFLANEILKNASIDFIAKNFQKIFQSNDNDKFLLIPKHLFKEIIGSKSLILYTNRGITITGEERELGIISWIKNYVNAQNITDEIVTFLPYLRLDLSDETRKKIFDSLSMEVTPFEVLSDEPRDYSLERSKESHRNKLGVAPRFTFIEEKTFEAFGNKKKFIDSIVITEKEWNNTIIVSGLKIDWSDGTSDIVGTREGNQVKLEVPEGEHVVSVVVKSGSYVDSLALVTSSGKVVGPAGGDGGRRKNVLECLGSNCDITRTFVDGISGCIVRTNSNPDTWTVARMKLKFVIATNKRAKGDGWESDDDEDSIDTDELESEQSLDMEDLLDLSDMEDDFDMDASDNDF